MGFASVYKSLQELFPLIDARVLRAVAIEHSKDADAAVEAVLEEIIPFFTERSTPTTPMSGSSINSAGESSAVQNGYVMNGGSQQSVRYDDDDGGRGETFHETYDAHLEGEVDGVSHSAVFGQTKEGSIEINSQAHLHSEPAVLVEKNGLSTLEAEVSGENETEQTLLDDKCPESSMKSPSASIPRDTLVTFEDVAAALSESMNFISKNGDFGNQLVNSTITNDKQEHVQEKSRAYGDDSVDDLASLNTDDQYMSTLDRSVQLAPLPDMNGVYLEEEFSSADNASKMDTAGNIVTTDDQSSISASLSQSRQMHIIDVLEEIVADARNNKKTMFCAMDSVISLMKEVEDKEKAAEQAKEEAAAGGIDILDKVEDLTKMLQHAREANDMHAGEIYGEKAILATELKELQSRVLSLSDERDKSLSVLDEMRRTLETRLAAAECVIKSAEQEKIEKEKSAKKALAEQELIMEKVVQEANILKQHAEDNAKLQEFLVDRGHVVDMLQGEIAVICQDVRLLKQKFDENVPFSKSVSSSQTSCKLASSSSSLKSLIPDQVEPTAELADSLEIKKNDLSSSSDERESEVKVSREDHKALLEDGWEIFDDPSY